MRNKDYLPPFPRTPHLRYNPNLDKDDILADDGNVVFESPILVEEKIDGSNVGIAIVKGELFIRNRDRFLSKGTIKDTAAKKQYAPIWNWYYKNKEKFENLDYSVYGEWMWARHGIRYEGLPDFFIAFDLYDYEQKYFLDPTKTREILTSREFAVPPLVFEGKVESYEELAALYNQKSEFSDELREGIYIRIGNGERLLNRFKMVRPDYIRGQYWNPEKLTKNNLKN